MQGRRVLLGWLQALAGAAVLAALVWKLGLGPFIDGLLAVDARAVAAAMVITLGATLCCAWRWQLVVRGLGRNLPYWPAVAAYYRSQFLNSVLPGGILGVVHRGVAKGSRDGDVGGGLRAVAWDRAAGQLVQLLLAVLVLTFVPSPLHGVGAVLAWVLLALAAVGAALLLWPPRPGAHWWARVLPAVAADLRHGLLRRRTAPGLGAAQGVSAAVVYGVLSLAACLPGAAVLLTGWLHRGRARGLTPMRRGPGAARGVRHG